MRKVIISKCEKSFTIKCLKEHIRVDGRAFEEFRKLTFDFGRDWGCCYVSLGETKVLASVSCEIQQPKTARPSEGLLNINVELSPMGAPDFEVGRQSELSVHLNRVLEKCIKDSRAVDLESLCIKTNEKVWALRVDINILNHAGNLLDCASIAAITALAHFKRPDVTCDGENIKIHSHKERDPISTTIHHYPVCVSYALFNSVDVYLADPTRLEEGVADAKLVFGINAFKEICSLHLGGKGLARPQLIYESASKAASRAFSVVTMIKEVIELDKQKRHKEELVNFNDIMDKHVHLDFLYEKLNVWKLQEKPKQRKKDRGKVKETEMEVEIEQEEITPVAENSGAVLDNTAENEAEFESSSDESIIEIKPPVERIDISDSDESEEEEVLILK